MARHYAALSLISRTVACVAAPSARMIVNGALRPMAAVTAQQAPGLVGNFTRGFTASGLRADASAKELQDLITKEIKSEKDSYEKPEEIKAGPPKPFELNEADGSSEVVLTRDFEKEKISVSFVVDDQERHEMAQPFDEEGDEEEDAFDKETVFFTVDITKSGTDDTLTFDCVTDGNNIDITGCTLDGADVADTSAYTGPPDFTVLDEELHTTFEKYLEARGINDDLALYIHDLSQDKEQREYMGWLTNMDKFLKA